MKKRLLLIALASTMLLAACNKNNNESQGEAVFTATTEHQGGRTSLDPNNGNINWTAGDQIVIANDNDETAIFSLRSGEGTTEGGFGTADDFNTVGPFVAAYPETATIANDVVTFNLPATQAMGETGTFANGANPMVACSDDKNLSFKNLCGGLGIRLKGVGAHVSAVRITSKNTSEKLWGTFEVSNCAANEPTLAEASGSQGSNVVTLTCDVTLTTVAKTFFVMLPPGTLANGFTMEVMDGNNVLATKETDSDVVLVERNNVKVFNEILIDVEFDGNVEIPTGMSSSDIIVTNYKEDAIPDENGDFAIGYSKMLVAKNVDNNEPIYFSVNSTDFTINKGVSENVHYELSAKETALYLALTNFPYGLSETSDEKFNALKNLLYSLDCVQQLEMAISNVVAQYGYLKFDALESNIETVKAFFYNQLVAPIIGNKNNREERLNPPHADPDHYGQLAKIDFLDEQYDAAEDSWDVLCRCWNGFAIWVGVIEGKILDENIVSFQPDLMADYIRPMTQSDALSLDSYLNWHLFVQRFQDLYGTISEYFINHQQYFQTAGKPSRDVQFNLNASQDAICYVGPEVNHVLVANIVGCVMETAKFVLGQLIGTNYTTETNFKMFVSEAMLDEELMRMIGNWIINGNYDTEGWKEIARREVHNIGVCLLNHGVFDNVKLNFWNEYTATYSAFAYASDLMLAICEWAHFNSFYFEVFDNPGVVTVSVENISGSTAMVNGRIASQGTQSIVERGVCYGTLHNPTVYDRHELADIPVNPFSCTLEGLQPGTTYYVRAYAINSSNNIGYGNEISFTTVNVPDVTTQAVTDITSSSAVVNAHVTHSDMSQVIERGFLYDTSPESLFYGNVGCEGVVYEGTSLYDFSCSITGLYANEDYYVKAYAKMAEGIGYGRVLRFHTLSSGGQIPTDGLVAYYPFNGNANDESGNGNNGEIIGNVVLTADRKGNNESACRFPGQPFNYISVSDAESLHLNIFTLNAWVYTDSEDYGSGYLICKGRDINNGSYRLCVRSVGATNEYGAVNDAWVEDNPMANEWHMITGTVQGNQAKFYIDGVLMDERTLSNPFVYGNNDPLTLGMHYYGGVPGYWAYPLLGVLDDIRIYNRVLTYEEIQALYNE